MQVALDGLEEFERLNVIGICLVTRKLIVVFEQIELYSEACLFVVCNRSESLLQFDYLLI